MVALAARGAWGGAAIVALTVVLVLSSGPALQGHDARIPTIVRSDSGRGSNSLPAVGAAHGASAPSNFPPPDWRLIASSGPSPPATGGSLAFLPSTQDVLWVGGASAGTVETWEYAAGNWTNVTASATGAPPANVGGRLAAAPFRDEVAWTSPYSGATSMGLWSFANGTWTNDSSLTPSPPARIDPAWATDRVDNAIVLFGGESNGIYRNDSWTLTGSGWSSVSTSRAPAARADAGLAAPGSTVALVLTGGVGAAGAFNDTWTYSSGSWSEAPGSGAPAGLTLGPNALAPTPGGDVLAFGGVGCATTNGLCNDTFEYVPTLAVWRNVSSQYPPSPRAGLELTYDAAAGYDFGYGGAIGAGAPTAQSWAVGGPLVTTLVISPTLAQPPSVAHFTAHAGGGYGTYNYSYHGQNVDCASKNLSNYTCNLDNDDKGNYTVTGQVQDQLGNLTSATAPFNVLLALTILANLSATAVDVGQPVNFSMVLSSGSTPSVIRWQDLPADCPVVSQAAFNCTSFDSGFYGVNCVVTDQYGTTSSSTTIQLVVAKAPAVLAWPSVTTGTAPLTVGFESAVGGGTAPYAYNWSFGDGTYGNTAAPTHTFTSNGTFAVALTVTDAVGYLAPAAGTITVTVAPALTVNITASAASWVAPATVELSANPVGGTAPYSYHWTLGNGNTATQEMATATYTSVGSYPVSLVLVDAAGRVATASSVVTVTAANASVGSSPGGASSTPAWELPAIGVAGVVVGLLIGIVVGRRGTGSRTDRSPDR